MLLSGKQRRHTVFCSFAFAFSLISPIVNKKILGFTFFFWTYKICMILSQLIYTYLCPRGDIHLLVYNFHVLWLRLFRDFVLRKGGRCSDLHRLIQHWNGGCLSQRVWNMIRLYFYRFFVTDYVKTDVNCTKQHFYLCVQEADVNTRSSLTKAPVQMNLFPWSSGMTSTIAAIQQYMMVLVTSPKR